MKYYFQLPDECYENASQEFHESINSIVESFKSDFSWDTMKWTPKKPEMFDKFITSNKIQDVILQTCKRRDSGLYFSAYAVSSPYIKILYFDEYFLGFLGESDRGWAERILDAFPREVLFFCIVQMLSNPKYALEYQESAMHGIYILYERFPESFEDIVQYLRLESVPIFAKSIHEIKTIYSLKTE